MTGCVCLGRGWCGFGRFGAVGRVVGEMVLYGAVLVRRWPARLKYKDNTCTGSVRYSQTP